MTGYIGDSALADTEEIEMATYLLKPVPWKTLRSAVGRLLEKHGAVSRQKAGTEPAV